MKIDTFKWRLRFNGNLYWKNFPMTTNYIKAILKHCINDICTTCLNRFLKTVSEALLRIAKMKLLVIMLTIILSTMLIRVKITTKT